MCSKPIFCSKFALKGKTCSRLLKPKKVAPNAKSCLKVAEHNRDRPCRVVKVGFVRRALLFQQFCDLSTVPVEPAFVSSGGGTEPLRACRVHGLTEHSPCSFHFSVTVLVTFFPVLKFLSQIFSIFNNAGNWTLFSVSIYLLTKKLTSLQQSG